MLVKFPGQLVKDRNGEPERGGGSEWEPIKILLEGDGDSNNRNIASNTLHRLTTQVGQARLATEVPLDLGTNTQPFDLRTQRNNKPECTDQHRSDRLAPPVRPVPTGETWRLP
jgi:hypothetical protein